MPVSRYRMSRSNDDDRVADTYISRRTSVRTTGILIDNGGRSSSQTPFRWGSTPLTGDASGQRIGGTRSLSTRAATRGGVSGRGLFGMPMTGSRRGGWTENTPPSGCTFWRGRGGRSGSHSVLPSWYPRTPLQDITHVVRAIERRRMHMGDGEGSIVGSPIPTAGQDRSLFSAWLEHEVSLVTPKPKLASKKFKPSTVGKIPTILTAIANKDRGSEMLTPQKKLLNSIDIVEKVVMEELNRLKRTPAAKRAEREKKVRTLMSMR